MNSSTTLFLWIALFGVALTTGVCFLLRSASKRREARSTFQRLGLQVSREPVSDRSPFSADTPTNFGSRDNADKHFSKLLAHAGPGVLNHRTEIKNLRLRGESPVAIASALGIAVGEVSLTLKLQEMSRGRAILKTQERTDAGPSELGPFGKDKVLPMPLKVANYVR